MLQTTLQAQNERISKITATDIDMNRQIISKITLQPGNDIALQDALGSFHTVTGTFLLRRAHYFNVQHDDAESVSTLNEERIENAIDREETLV